MKVSTVLIFAIAGLLLLAGAYWYQIEGADLIDQIRQSENKPFFFK